MLIGLLIVTTAVAIVFLIVQSFKAKNTNCSFELSVSFTKGFSLKFRTINKKDAPSNK